MKKLALTQIILGILVVGSLVFWIGWVQTGYHDAFGADPDGNIRFRILGLLKPNPLMGVWAVIYFMLGLSVLGSGIAQFLKGRRSKTAEEDKLEVSNENRGVRLSMTQIVLGALIIGSLVWFTGWVEWDYHPITRLVEGVEVEIRPLPGWMVRMISWKVLSFILGLGITGTGIVQLVKARSNETGN